MNVYFDEPEGVRPVQWAARQRFAFRVAGLTLLALGAAIPSPPRSLSSVELKRSGDRVDVLIGGQPFTTYYFGAGEAKPYLFPLRSASGNGSHAQLPDGKRHTRRRPR